MAPSSPSPHTPTVNKGRLPLSVTSPELFQCSTTTSPACNPVLDWYAFSRSSVDAHSSAILPPRTSSPFHPLKNPVTALDLAMQLLPKRSKSPGSFGGNRGRVAARFSPWARVAGEKGRVLDTLFSKGNTPFLHGAIHLLPDISRQYGIKDIDCIVVLDVDTEEYRQEIRLPAYLYSCWGDYERCCFIHIEEFLNLTSLGGSLCLTINLGKINERLMELWLLKDYNNGEWVKGYTIDLSVYPDACDPFMSYLVDTEGDDILLSYEDKLGVSSLLGYNLQGGTVIVKKRGECAATFYMETFYSPRN